MNIFLPKNNQIARKNREVIYYCFQSVSNRRFGRYRLPDRFRDFVAVFYLLPVAMTAWFCERNAALFTSLGKRGQRASVESRWRRSPFVPIN
jgi:hypothetical protein